MVCCSLPVPQCRCGQNRCVHCSWPSHSARERSWLCGYLWSAGWTAQREDVHGAESGEFTSNWKVYFFSSGWISQPRENKQKTKKGFILHFIWSCSSGIMVILLFTSWPAVIPSPWGFPGGSYHPLAYPKPDCSPWGEQLTPKLYSHIKHTFLQTYQTKEVWWPFPTTPSGPGNPKRGPRTCEQP